ncbi:hypothetical protein CYMTET_16601, partial [Cymbomonas tetramitiformis]
MTPLRIPYSLVVFFVSQFALALADFHHSATLKIYTYELRESVVNQGATHCGTRHSAFRFESNFIKYLAQLPQYSTSDPSQADYYFVPVVPYCHMRGGGSAKKYIDRVLEHLNGMHG